MGKDIKVTDGDKTYTANTDDLKEVKSSPGGILGGLADAAENLVKAGVESVTPKGKK